MINYVAFRKWIIDSIRKTFRFRIAERFLYNLAKGRERKSFWRKLIPTELLYRKNSIRSVIRDGIHYELDICNLNDHWVYFGYDDPNIFYLFSLIVPDFVVIDVGANIGFTTLNMANRCKGGKVYSYEPDALNFQRLERNASLNKLPNVQLIRKGLGSENKSVEMVKVDVHNSGMNRILPAINQELSKETISITTLDDEVKRLDIEKIDLIKIDVEGYEWYVLNGAINTIKLFRPALFIELIDANLKPHGHNGQMVIKWINQFGYKVVDVKTRRPLSGSEDVYQTDIICFPSNTQL